MNFVSTMNRKVFHDFGYRLLESFEKYSSEGDHLYVYTEDSKLKEVVERCLCFQRCTVLEFSDQRITDFLRHYRDKDRFRGIVSYASFFSLRRFLRLIKGKKVVGRLNYNFLRDVYRFSFKPFAIWQFLTAMLSSNVRDLTCYVDADCSFIGTIPAFGQMPELAGVDVGYFGRPSYTETGVMFFRPVSHVSLFCDSWVSYYLSGSFKGLDGWTDCHTFDQSRVECNYDLRFVDLNASSETNHPIAKSFLAPFLDHRKGDRKPMEFSPELTR